jgi:hypothetical protein
VIKQKDWDLIESAISQLPVKKKWQIKINGNRAKVVRSSETEYTVYYDGHFIQTVADWQDAFEFVKAVLIVDKT